MSSSLPEQDDPGSGAPAAWWDAASPVGGDVVLSGAVLLFMAIAFAFVLYHYFTISRRGQRDGAGAGVPSSSGQRVARGTVGGDAAAAAANTAGIRGGVSPALLRALPLTVYSAKGRAGEALECAVCLAEAADGEAARFLPRCGHGFHAECVDLWLRGHSTCPLCRVDVVGETGALALPPPALPPALPEPANYPTNVLFWGSQDAVTTTTARPAGGAVGVRSSSAGASAAALVIEVRDGGTAPAVAPPPPPPREGGAAKPLGLARLSSLRRLWNRGRHDDTADTSTRSCHRATGAGDGSQQAPASPLDIWNIT